jgi:hypothetical protein
MNLHGRNAKGGYGGNGLEYVTQYVEEGDVDDRLELAQEQVSQQGSEYRGEITQENKSVVNSLE